MIEQENMRESFEKIDFRKRKRYIVDKLFDFPDGLTAKELAVMMRDDGLVPDLDRNHSHPSITFLKDDGVIYAADKKYDPSTGRSVSVYKILDTTKARAYQV